MKNRSGFLLLLLTTACIAFILGLFLGRNYAGTPVIVSIPETESPQTTAASGISQQEELVNINTAGLSELSALPGIGEIIAQRIIDYREANGPFETVTDLLNVEGIGEKRLEEILSLITAGG